ncbi:MAG: type III secretion system ATPase SctN [Halopseudomonas aestusnigri]
MPLYNSKPNLAGLNSSIQRSPTIESFGRVETCVGTVIKANASLSIGDTCVLHHPGGKTVGAEVIGVDGEQVLLTAMGSMQGLSTRTRIVPTGRQFEVPVGDALLGRVINAIGEPIDDGPDTLKYLQTYPGYALPPNPLKRPIINTPLSLGVRAMDGLLTCSEGQRIGIFAAAGGGKSSLLSMLIKSASADVMVIALIGERGREVREFIELQLGEEGLKRSIVVVATSDRPAIEQVKAAYTATAVSEYFRDQGCKVLLMMDSITRFARAQRQIGLAVGEPPTRRGFPPSVFEKLPSLVERAGRTEAGSITAFYTVLVEGDDMTEPVADETRSLLDGHVLLSRDLAGQGHYPAIDVLGSVSRVMNAIVTEEHNTAANKLRGLLAKYSEIELLLKIGEYKAGSDAEADEAISKVGAINKFLQQKFNDPTPLDETISRLLEVTS